MTYITPRLAGLFGQAKNRTTGRWRERAAFHDMVVEVGLVSSVQQRSEEVGGWQIGSTNCLIWLVPVISRPSPITRRPSRPPLTTLQPTHQHLHDITQPTTSNHRSPLQRQRIRPIPLPSLSRRRPIPPPSRCTRPMRRLLFVRCSGCSSSTR